MSLLARTIFDQFIAMAQKEAAKTGCSFTPCNANYSVEHLHSGTSLHIEYVSHDSCDRQTVYGVTIDITGICFQDLSTESWQHYLQTKVVLLLSQICPPAIPVEPKKTACRCKPVVCTLPPAKTTTYIPCTPVPPTPPVEHIVVLDCCEHEAPRTSGCSCNQSL
jgi:hypothetical protein